MWEVFELLRLIAASQLMLAIVLLLLNMGKSKSVAWATLLFLSIEAYLLAPLIVSRSHEFPIIAITLLMSDTLPLFLWLLANRLFSDEAEISTQRKVLAIGAASYVCVSAGLKILSDAPQPELFSVSGILIEFIPKLLQIGLVLLAVWEVSIGFREDLVEKRRRLRIGVLAVVSFYALAILIVEIVFYAQMPEFLETVHSGGLVVTVMLACIAMLSIEKGLFLPAEKSSVLMIISDLEEVVDSASVSTRPGLNNGQFGEACMEPTVAGASAGSAEGLVDDSAEDPIFLDLKSRISQGELYKEERLTIRLLADRLSCPEYKLRKVINGRMGYRNFNEFLNHYRIAEASQRLLAENEKHLPILTIALDVGYRSLSTFNKAFKECHGMTPSDFRQKCAGEIV